MPTDKRQRQKQGQQARRKAALEAARRDRLRKRAISLVVLVAVVVGLMFLVSHHGGSKKTSAKAAGTTTTAPSVSTTSTSLTPAKAADEPKIAVPPFPAPTALETIDSRQGTGKAAKLGDTIEVNYVGATYSDGKVFDSSWKRGSTAAFQLAVGSLIKGWTDGIPGMKVGGRRELIIPGPLAYGDKNNGDGRPVGTLIFIIDLVSIQ